MNRLLNKLTSGQWLLTVLSGFTVSYCVMYQLDVPEWAQVLFASVFTLYFKRDRPAAEDSSKQ